MRKVLTKNEQGKHIKRGRTHKNKTWCLFWWLLFVSRSPARWRLGTLSTGSGHGSLVALRLGPVAMDRLEVFWLLVCFFCLFACLFDLVCMYVCLFVFFPPWICSFFVGWLVCDLFCFFKCCTEMVGPLGLSNTVSILTHKENRPH